MYHNTSITLFCLLNTILKWFFIMINYKYSIINDYIKIKTVIYNVYYKLYNLYCICLRMLTIVMLFVLAHSVPSPISVTSQP